jgi:hypothetical protein
MITDESIAERVAAEKALMKQGNFQCSFISSSVEQQQEKKQNALQKTTKITKRRRPRSKAFFLAIKGPKNRTREDIVRIPHQFPLPSSALDSIQISLCSPFPVQCAERIMG